MLRPNITPVAPALHVEARPCAAPPASSSCFTPPEKRTSTLPAERTTRRRRAARRLAQRAVGLGAALVVLLGLVELHDVGAQLLRHPRRVVLRVERALAALGVDGAAARIGPHHDRHAEPLAVLAHLLELADLLRPAAATRRRACTRRRRRPAGPRPRRSRDSGETASASSAMFVLPLSFRIRGTRPQYSFMYFSARPMPSAIAE